MIKRALRFVGRVIKDLLREEDRLTLLKRNGLKVGDNFKMQCECLIDESHCWHIEIGNNVTLAPRVHILAHDASTKVHFNYTKLRNVKIGDNVFVGAGAIIMPGVKIGDNAIIGAGSVVTKDIPAKVVAAGNPAKVVCTLDEYIAVEKGRMNAENCFNESYTLRQNVDDKKKQQMVEVTDRYGQSFVV